MASGSRRSAKRYAHGRTSTRVRRKFWAASRASSPSELPRLLLHEATAHAGLRKVLGDGLDLVLDSVWEAHAAEPEMLRIVERYFPGAEWSEAAGPDGETVREARLSEAQRREAAEEFVARYADGRVNAQYWGVEPAWWTELKQRVRMLLARLGWARAVAMDDREIETLLARAHRALGSPEWAARREGGIRARPRRTARVLACLACPTAISSWRWTPTRTSSMEWTWRTIRRLQEGRY